MSLIGIRVAINVSITGQDEIMLEQDGSLTTVTSVLMKRMAFSGTGSHTEERLENHTECNCLA